MGKLIKDYEILPLLEKFIKDSKSGRRLQKNGKRFRKSSIEKYETLFIYLGRFSTIKKRKLRVRQISRLNKRELARERNYWKQFYREFTDHHHNVLNHFDNYVATMIKSLRTLFNYLNNEKGLNIGTFHKNFYVRSEDIPVVVLSPERLNYLIYSKTFEDGLSEKLKMVKDIFVFGCTVGLRVSDLLNLNQSNLEYINERIYLKARSRKTQTYTMIKLPDYAVNILNKFKCKNRRLFPPISLHHFNYQIKNIAELAGWTEECVWQREKRGVLHYIYKDPAKKTHYRFCDILSSHTMRRTAITTMLSLGMREEIVRKISGHAPNSKDFYKYVNYAQSYIDTEIDGMYKALKKKKLAKERSVNLS